jgi:hypothetical protein
MHQLFRITDFYLEICKYSNDNLMTIAFHNFTEAVFSFIINGFSFISNGVMNHNICFLL